MHSAVEELMWAEEDLSAAAGRLELAEAEYEAARRAVQTAKLALGNTT